MPSPLEIGKDILITLSEAGRSAVKAGKEFPKHVDWYNKTLPGLLSASHPELGTFRLTGSPRDTAAEYAGALDWARRSPLSADTDILLAKIYQFLNHGTTKAAKDNLKQDIAAILYGKGKTLSDKEIVDLAAKYAAENSFGRGPVDYNPELLNNEDTMLYAGGGSVDKDEMNQSALVTLKNILKSDPDSVFDALVAERNPKKAKKLVAKNIEGGIKKLETPEGALELALNFLPIGSIKGAPELIKKSKIAELKDKLLERKGKYGAERVEKAADLVPNLEKQYDEEALYRAFIGDGDNAAGLMVMSPKSFESYSQPLWDEYVEPEYIRELAEIARQKGFKDVPYLLLGRKESEYLPRDLQELYIAGHEGRHRTRALDKLGDKSTLIRMIPRSSMREHLPRRSQEEYIDALNKELGLYPLVRPEKDTEEVRSLVRLPEIFAQGGLACLTEPRINRL